MKNLTDNQKLAYEWWNSLSINEMKSYAKKYYPVLWEWAYTYTQISYIEPIYNQEHKDQKG